MPSQKPLSKYDSSYRELFLRAYEKGILFVATPTATRADVLRKELYNFRQALREETPLPPTEADHALLVAANALTFKVRGNSVCITLKTSVFNSIINKALETSNE